MVRLMLSHSLQPQSHARDKIADSVITGDVSLPESTRYKAYIRGIAYVSSTNVNRRSCYLGLLAFVPALRCVSYRVQSPSPLDC